MPSFTKIVSTALVGFAAFATLASAVDQAEFGNKVRALREGDNLPRHIVHDMHQKVRMARALRGPARMDDEKRAVAEPVIEERAVAAPVPVEERSLSVPMEERGLGHPNFVKRWLFGLFGPPPPPVVAAVVAAKVQAIKQTLTFLNDAFHCGVIAIVCPHDYVGSGTPACVNGVCQIICPAGQSLVSVSRKGGPQQCK